MSTKKKKPKGRYAGQLGGARPNSGRRKKPDKRDYVQVTCILRKDTVDKLRAGTGSESPHPQYGEFLQFHLDRHPLPTHEEYQFLRQQVPITIKTKRRREVPVLVTQVVQPLRKRAPVPRDDAFEKALAQHRKQQNELARKAS